MRSLAAEGPWSLPCWGLGEWPPVLSRHAWGSWVGKGGLLLCTPQPRNNGVDIALLAARAPFVLVSCGAGGMLTVVVGGSVAMKTRCFS